jgi:murein DD-endopeptidase MepM/ murein hydrolase activator NlpD
VIALATAMQESLLRNTQRGDRDSLGLFQQRPSQGWGTAEQILDPRYSAGKFYEKLQRIPNWEAMPLTDAAQAVQVSGIPGAYQKWEDEANFLVAAVAGRDIGDLLGPQVCVTVGQLSSQGWTAPAPGNIGSGFRTPERPGHDGADILAHRRTAIVAAANGLVVTAMCNASTGNCDTDGSPSVLGCGWYVEIDHGGGISTRYCHMQQRPMVAEGQQVRAGQQLGIVGSSGNSSGPHLHFETHINGEPVDPVPFMQERGAPLGQSAAAQAKAN